MSEFITDNFMASVTTQKTAKPVATKESAAWRNIFDKSLFNMLKYAEATLVTTNTRNVETSTVMSGEQHKSDSALIYDARNDRGDSTVKNTTHMGKSVIDRKHVTLAQANTLNQESQYIGQNTLINNRSGARLITSAAQKVDNAAIIQRLALDHMGSQFTSRIHFTVHNDEVRIYMRGDRDTDKKLFLTLEDLISKFNFKGLAIREIRFNGRKY